MENKNMNGTINNTQGNYTPPKMWKELTVEEKLERIREHVKHLQNGSGYTNSQILDLKNDFQNHDHLQGKVVKDIKTYNGGLGVVGKLANPKAEADGEVYF